MSEITILHLSDIHFRKKKSKNKDDENKLFRQDVQQKLIDTVSRHLKENTVPGVVAVTGDIAFSGKKPEYDDALEFFEKLKCILPKETEFLAVPGNHDVDRDEVDEFIEPYYVVKNNLEIWCQAKFLTFWHVFKRYKKGAMREYQFHLPTRGLIFVTKRKIAAKTDSTALLFRRICQTPDSFHKIFN